MLRSRNPVPYPSLEHRTAGNPARTQRGQRAGGKQRTTYTKRIPEYPEAKPQTPATGTVGWKDCHEVRGGYCREYVRKVRGYEGTTVRKDGGAKVR